MSISQSTFTVGFFVPGKPVGKGRPRFYGGHAVTPKGTRHYEALVRAKATAAVSPVPEIRNCNCFAVEIQADYPVPKSATKKRLQDIHSGISLPQKPDLDNVIKAILDGAQGAVFGDDAMVTSIKAVKQWALEKDPGVTVTITGFKARQNFCEG